VRAPRGAGPRGLAGLDDQRQRAHRQPGALPLSLDATVAPTLGATHRVAAVLRATGTAALFDVEATLRGVPWRACRACAGRTSPLQLLQAWPLAA